MRTWRRVWSVPVAIMVCAGSALSATDLRIPATFPLDATPVERPWLETTLSFRALDGVGRLPDAQDMLLTWTGALAAVRRLEVGGRLSYIARDYDREALDDPSGLSDALLWAKLRLHEERDFVLTGGGLATLPLGDERDGLGDGSVNLGAFLAAGVHTRGAGFVQAHVGLRSNGDLEHLGGDLDGKPSILIGFGGVMPTPQGFEAFGAFALETERWSEGDSFAQLSAGGRWLISGPWRLQAQASVGFADAAPQLELSLGLVCRP